MRGLIAGFLFVWGEKGTGGNNHKVYNGNRRYMYVGTYNNNRLRSQAYIAEIVRKQETSFRQIMTRAPRRKHGITRYDDSLQEDHQSGIPARLVCEDAEEECGDDTECVASGGKNVDVDDAPAVPF